MNTFLVKYSTGLVTKFHSDLESVEAFCNQHFGSTWEGAKAHGATVTMTPFDENPIMGYRFPKPAFLLTKAGGDTSKPFKDGYRKPVRDPTDTTELRSGMDEAGLLAPEAELVPGRPPARIIPKRKPIRK